MTTNKPTTTKAEIQSLRDEVADLRAELVAFQAALAREVRTERLAVVHPLDGRELITTKVRVDSVALQLSWLPETDAMHTDAALVVGVDGPDQSFSDIYVSAGGDILGMFSANAKTDDEGRVSADGSLSLESSQWRDAALGTPLVGPTGVNLDAKGLTFS